MIMYMKKLKENIDIIPILKKEVIKNLEVQPRKITVIIINI